MFIYERNNHRAPAKDFLAAIPKPMRNRFYGQFGALTTVHNYCNNQRFKPLSGKGKPLWEFKEFDHRIYCFRKTVGNRILVVLLSGWVKDKGGKTDREAREIKSALDLCNYEFLRDFPGGEGI